MIERFYQWFSYRGLSPHKLMPMTGVHKRIGAFLFLLFLHKNRLQARQRFSNNALVALTLLIAASDPGQKEILVRLTVNLIE